MTRAAALGATLLSLAAVALAEESVEWTAVPAYAGRSCTVRGRVAATAVDGRVVRLFFDATRRDVSVALLRAWINDFPPDPQVYYRDKDVEVTGVVRRFQRQHEIVVKDAGAIRVVSAEAPSTPDAARPDEVQELREEVHRLQERLDEMQRQPPR